MLLVHVYDGQYKGNFFIIEGLSLKRCTYCPYYIVDELD